MKTLLLVKYNKVINDAFQKLSIQATNISTKFADLSQYGKYIDNLEYEVIDSFFEKLKEFDAVLIGDIFWKTGQNICKWCQENNVPCFFLQHGQWIYTENKKSPNYLPTTTFVYGDNLKNEMKTWDYSNKSKIEVVGNPRYDLIDYKTHRDDNYIYFVPPVIHEKNPSAPDIVHSEYLSVISQLKGIDKKVNLRIHPHYREGSVKILQDIFPNAQFIDVSDNPLDHIKNCSKVLTHRNSTTVLDAIASHKLAVLCNLIGAIKSYYIPMYFDGFTMESNSPTHCVELLQSKFIVDEQNYSERARPFIYLGNASSRILGIIDKILA